MSSKRCWLVLSRSRDYLSPRGRDKVSSPVILQGKALKIQFPGIGGLYQGTLSADGNSIAGGLLQNGTTLTLNLVRATAQTRRQRGRFPGPPARDLLVAGGAQEEFNPGQCKMPNGAKPSFGTPVVCRKLGFWHSSALTTK